MSSVFVALILILGMLPSLTALSDGLAHAAPWLYRFTGPINALKLGAPILLYYCFRERKRIGPRLVGFSIALLGMGTLFTLIAASGCADRAGIFREWSVFVLGWFGALSLYALPPGRRFGVVSAWVALVYGSALVDAVVPSWTAWLYAHVFDPNTLKGDIAELGRRVLTGVFGRQSLAKLLAWLPWLWIALASKSRWASRPGVIVGAVLALASPVMILGTSQRGPFIAMLAAIGIYGAHRALRLKKLAPLAWSGAGGCLAVVLTLALVPRAIWEPRMMSLLGMHAGVNAPAQIVRAETTAIDNAEFRVRMNRLSFREIAEHPLGDACIPPAVFQEAGLFKAHAHNLFLEQYRSKGWIWGTIHLLLWLGAFLGAWRRKDVFGSALLAGVTAIIVSGLVDHPWFVLNHAMVLASFLIIGLFSLPEAQRAR